MISAILLSGGMDSTALACWEKPPLAITIDYGQVVAAAEIRASAKIAEELQIRHEVIKLNCRALGSGDLAGTPPNALAPASEWWPYRNQLLITVAAMKAVALGVSTLLYGTVKSDNFHADGRPEFFAAVGHLLALQEGGLKIAAPALAMTSAELIRRSGIKPRLLAWSHSCHVSNYACGRCRGCNKHRETMAELGYEPY